MPINKVPDFPSYTGFWLLWIVGGFVAYLLCIVLFLSGHWISGVITVLATVILYWRNGVRIAKQRELRSRFSYGSRYGGIP